jgi:hypothetical protein
MFSNESTWRTSVEHERTPLQDGRRLTPELFDYYVAQARAERAKAIAEFGGTLVARLSGIVARLARHVPIAS